MIVRAALTEPDRWRIIEPVEDTGAQIDKVIGMFVVTLIGNVPLNNRLDAADPASAEGKAVWSDYLTRWTLLNHLRTVACIASMALLVAGLG